ncbi:MAG: hypothetical protein H6828_15110 [Planctomycetes bacterium]|nr:hypothetical protein [Planctomycetota bacterium]
MSAASEPTANGSAGAGDGPAKLAAVAGTAACTLLLLVAGALALRADRGDALALEAGAETTGLAVYLFDALVAPLVVLASGLVLGCVRVAPGAPRPWRRRVRALAWLNLALALAPSAALGLRFCWKVVAGA